MNEHRETRRASALLVIAAVAAAASCVGGEEPAGRVEVGGRADSPAPSHHVAGQPTNGADVFQWVDVGDDALETHRSTIFPPPRRGRVLGADHELTLRYQTFVDRIDAYVREVRPDLTESTPRPRVRVYDDGLANAWASGVPVCVDAPVTFERDPGAGEGREYFAAILHHGFVEPLEERTAGGGFFGEPSRPTEPCVEAPYSGEVEEFVAWINRRRGPCRYELRDGRIHVSGASCRIERGRDDFGGARSARYHAVIPYVFITTAFVELIGDEDQIVGVLAHELAHYYKAHATNADFVLTGDIFEGGGEEDYSPSGQGYNYFYTQTRVPQPIRPAPRDDSDRIRRAVLRFAPNQGNPFKDVGGASLDPTLGRFVVSLVYGGELPTDRVASCRRAHEIVMDSAFYNLVYAQQLSADEQAAYLELEGAFLECAREVSVPSDLALGRLLAAFSTPMGIELPGFETQGGLEDIVLELDRRMRVYSEEERDFYAFMEREAIGYYTAEQEADELGAELMAGIGLDPMAHALLDLRGGELREAEAPAGFLRVNGLDMARCRELFDNDWIDPATGAYVFVPVGSLSDIHHGPCYRAFNLSREVAAHGYGEPGG